MLNNIVTYMLGILACVLGLIITRWLFKSYVELINESIDQDIEYLMKKYVYGKKEKDVNET